MNLRNVFNELITDYFPELMGHGWRIRLQPNLALTGQCKPEKKMILLKYVIENETELKSFLLHELCHTKALGHAVKFITVMLRVLRTILKKTHDYNKYGHLSLKELNLEELRKQFSDNVKLYEEWKKEIQKYVEAYGQKENVLARLGDWAVDAPKASYDVLRRALARDCGFSLKEFDKRYGKRTKETYRKMKESDKQEKNLMQKFQEIKRFQKK